MSGRTNLGKDLGQVATVAPAGGGGRRTGDAVAPAGVLPLLHAVQQVPPTLRSLVPLELGQRLGDYLDSILC